MPRDGAIIFGDLIGKLDSVRVTYRKHARVLIALALATGVASCGDECREYSDFTCKQIETADYNVIFSFPSATQNINLGQAKRLSQCGQIARSFAATKNLSGNNVCCMIAKGSNCYEKHR